jgi:hypothetical protein
MNNQKEYQFPYKRYGNEFIRIRIHKINRPHYHPNLLNRNRTISPSYSLIL